MKLPILILLILCLSVFNAQQSLGQTTIQGKVLSADGSPIPKTVISIRSENPRDIFSGHYDDIFPGDDGMYQFQIHEPGLYRVTFRGVFHSNVSLPVMVYDQPSMDMDIFLMPVYYNDGAYFGNEEYLKWIRIYGNFNNYSYNDGESFSLNKDGSISALIPVTSDTIRYLVRGLTYGRGATPLSAADEYFFNEGHGFESVLYNDLPEDSLEIRYAPGEDIPYKRYLPADINPQRITLSGFIYFEDRRDQFWVEPLTLTHFQYIRVHYLDREFSLGIPDEMQKKIQKKYIGGLFGVYLAEIEEKIISDLKTQVLHPQQHILLTLAYASVFLDWKRRRMFIHRYAREEELPDIQFNMEIIRSIPDTIPPVHPAWSLHRNLADVLLNEGNADLKLANYFNDLVKYHPNDRTVHSTALALIRFFALDYESVEMIPVYPTIVERYGEAELAREAHRLFDVLHYENGIKK